MARALAITLAVILAGISFAFGAFFSGVGGHAPTEVVFCFVVPLVVVGVTIKATKPRVAEDAHAAGSPVTVHEHKPGPGRVGWVIAVFLLLIPLVAYLGLQILGAGVTP